MALPVVRPVVESIGQDVAELPDLRQVLERIAAGLLARADVAELVEGCGAGAGPDLAERFRAALGMDPAAYVRRRRMEAAARLLRETDLSVERIGALLSGCRSPGAFYRVFRAWSGCTPGAYRRGEARKE